MNELGNRKVVELINKIKSLFFEIIDKLYKLKVSWIKKKVKIWIMIKG